LQGVSPIVRLVVRIIQEFLRADPLPGLAVIVAEENVRMGCGAATFVAVKVE
jgi:hypothetical protein